MSTDPTRVEADVSPVVPRGSAVGQKGVTAFIRREQTEREPRPRAFRWEAARRHWQRRELTKAAVFPCSHCGLNLLEG